MTIKIGRMWKTTATSTSAYSFIAHKRETSNALSALREVGKHWGCHIHNTVPDTNHNANPTNPNTRYRCEWRPKLNVCREVYRTQTAGLHLACLTSTFPVHQPPHACNKIIKNTDLCYFHMQLTWLNWTGLGLGLVVFGLGLITVFFGLDLGLALSGLGLGLGLTMFWSH